MPENHKAYVIAEIGNNHQGSLLTCKQLFDAAAWAGCDAVKLQKRDIDTLYTREYLDTPYNSENSYGKTYGEHRRFLEFGLMEYQELQGYADHLGIEFFATAFDLPSLRFLLDIDVPRIKLASGDLTNITLLEACRASQKPIILSTGGGVQEEITAAYELLKGCDLTILHCTSAYPAHYDEINLRCITSNRLLYHEAIMGWSAHDTGIALAPVAYALGARVIEKHFTLDRTWKGTDQAFSLEPQGMKTMIENLEHTRQALGDGIKVVYDSEHVALTKQRKNGHGRVDGKAKGRVSYSTQSGFAGVGS